jgi:ABC-type Fe3+/spermidine/putrescine transport system ATPase subunit
LLQLRMRVELRALQRRLRITFIHVTHNQEEALAIADQIVVMQDGRIQQVGSPQDVYRHPANLFTSGFMGDNNVVPGKVSAIADGQVWVEGEGLRLLARHDGAGVAVGQNLHASVRAGSVSAEPAIASAAALPERPNQVLATLIFVEYLGDIVKLHCRLANDQTIVAKRAENIRVWDHLVEGQPVRLEWEPADVQLLLA